MTAKRYKTNCLCLQTRRADRVINRLYNSFISKTGLQSTQYGLLRCISTLDNPCMADIGAALCMDQTTVSRNLAKLEKAGFIFTFPSETDTRKANIRITQLGHEKLAEATLAWEQAQKTAKGKMGEEEFVQLFNLLDKIVDALDCV